MSKKADQRRRRLQEMMAKNQDFKGIISIPCMDVRTTSESCCFHFFSRLPLFTWILYIYINCSSQYTDCNIGLPFRFRCPWSHDTPTPQIPFFHPTSDHNWVEWWLNYNIWKLVVAEQHVKKTVEDDNEADEDDEYKSCTYLTDKFYLVLESLNFIVTEWHQSKLIALGHPFMPTERGPGSQAMLPPHCC